MTDTDTPSWGIEPVPERLRVLGTLDGLLLWSNLSVSLLVIVAGAFGAPSRACPGGNRSSRFRAHAPGCPSGLRSHPPNLIRIMPAKGVQ